MGMQGDANRKRNPGGQKLSRRELLKMAGLGGAGLLLGAGIGAGGARAAGKLLLDPAGSGSGESVPFFADRQAGIATPQQNVLLLAAFDLTVRRLDGVRRLMRAWTSAAERMSRGKPVAAESANDLLPPTDTGEAAGLLPSRLTFTFGAGPSLFDGRFGLSARRTAALAELPAFAGDALKPEWCGGDLGVQICADDLQVAFHALRNLARIARGSAVLRWTQEGFLRGGGPETRERTPRNLLGFKDGTVNPDVRDSGEMDRHVWAQASDGAPWMAGGSYMVARRIRMRIEVWDRSTLRDQEATFGRHRDSGAPLGQRGEFETPDFAGGAIPADAHIRLAHGDGSEKILRRSYSYFSGMDAATGQLDAGLVFICYQRDPRRQFVPIQQRLSAHDALNEYVEHVGSAVFACFPGVREGGFVGESLFA